MSTGLVESPQARGLIAALMALAGGLPTRPRPRVQSGPAPDRACPPGKQWVRHVGQQQRIRAMRQSARRVAKLTDQASELAREAIAAAAAGEPDPEWAELHLTHAAMICAEETKVPWAMAAAHILRAFQRNAEEGEIVAAPA